jgi:hypothetical protein
MKTILYQPLFINP